MSIRWNACILGCVSILVCAGLGACSSKEVVVVYSPHGADILRDYEALFEAKYPEVDMQPLDMGSQEVYNRVRAERNRPACDVWWGAPSTMFMQAAKDGLLDVYTPAWADKVTPAHKDAHGLWFGTHLTPLCIMFNDRKYSAETVPQTWDQLLDPAWAGKITMRKPLPSGTMRTFIGAMVLRAPNEDAGFEFLRRLHQSTKAYMETPQMLFDHIKRNEDMITVWIMPDAVLQRERHGYPFGYVLPPPTPVFAEGIAIVKGAQHRAWAEKFLEFVTTPENLAHQAKEYGKIPARTDIDPATLPEWMVKQPIDEMPIDWDAFAAKEKDRCERWEREVYSGT